VGSVIALSNPAGAHWFRSAAAGAAGTANVRPQTIKIVAANPSSFSPRFARRPSHKLITATVSAGHRFGLFRAPSERFRAFLTSS
jgi:hypothetical protein